MNLKDIVVHVVAPFHSRLMKEHWSHCAFTQITIKQIAIFKHLGCRVIDYSNFGSESMADERVEVLDSTLYHRYFQDNGLPGNSAVIGSPGWGYWYAHLRDRIQERVSSFPGIHVVAHTYAYAAKGLLTDLPNHVLHFESHVGYDRPPFGAKRVFVSEAWRHHHWGKYPSEVADRRWSWVVHPYYNEAEWPLNPSPSGEYVAYMGRITASKGISTIQAMAVARPDWKFKVAGSGDLTPFEMPANVEHVGILPGGERAKFLGHASVQVLPTEYVEPCAGSVIEGMLCGTPAVTSSWGGFVETVAPGVSGYTASMLDSWLAGVGAARGLDRVACADYARRNFTLEVAAAKYAVILDELTRLRLGGGGWYANVVEQA